VFKAVTRIVFLAGICFQANAQDYPSRPVRFLVGYPPSGGMDIIARIVAPRLASALGQPFFVDNRVGAGGAIAADALVHAAPDGYTLLLAESGTLIVPLLNPKVTYDAVKQFAPVGGVCSLPLALVVAPGFPAANVRELIGVLKASPGKYSYASPGVGTLQHLAFELFQGAAGVDVVHVPYKGASSMLPDLMAGQVQVGIVSATVAVAQAKSGKIRALAVTGPQRMPAAPQIPALAETLPGFNAAPNVFLVAPAGATAGVVQRVSAALRAALGTAEVRESLAKQGATPMSLAPRELGAQIADEMKRWAAVVKHAGVKLD
jgi:tripartite-type tricarboxylate transporter receptor subunit TctC